MSFALTHVHERPRVKAVAGEGGVEVNIYSAVNAIVEGTGTLAEGDNVTVWSNQIAGFHANGENDEVQIIDGVARVNGQHLEIAKTLPGKTGTVFVRQV